MGFSAEWLALREPADHRARDPGLLAQTGRWLADKPEPVIVDLGCGTGSNARALVKAAPPQAHWRFVDHDPALLGAVARYAEAAGLAFEAVEADLAHAPAETLPTLLAEADLVTGSALLDLVSDDWLAALVAALPPRAAVYITLSVNGREAWRPRGACDRPVRAAFDRDQARDKGFGPALGPKAGRRFARLLAAAGRRVETAASPWRLTRASDARLIAELAEGYAELAERAGQAEAAAVWRTTPRETVEIGHLDVLAGPATCARRPAPYLGAWTKRFRIGR